MSFSIENVAVVRDFSLVYSDKIQRFNSSISEAENELSKLNGKFLKPKKKIQNQESVLQNLRDEMENFEESFSLLNETSLKFNENLESFNKEAWSKGKEFLENISQKKSAYEEEIESLSEQIKKIKNPSLLKGVFSVFKAVALDVVADSFQENGGSSIARNIRERNSRNMQNEESARQNEENELPRLEQMLSYIQSEYDSFLSEIESYENSANDFVEYEEELEERKRALEEQRLLESKQISSEKEENAQKVKNCISGLEDSVANLQNSIDSGNKIALSEIVKIEGFVDTLVDLKDFVADDDKNNVERVKKYIKAAFADCKASSGISGGVSVRMDEISSMLAQIQFEKKQKKRAVILEK